MSEPFAEEVIQLAAELLDVNSEFGYFGAPKVVGLFVNCVLLHAGPFHELGVGRVLFRDIIDHTPAPWLELCGPSIELL